MGNYYQILSDLENTIPPIVFDSMDPVPSTFFSWDINLDARVEDWRDYSVDIKEIYDDLGNEHEVSLMFLKKGLNLWEWTITSDDESAQITPNSGSIFFNNTYVETPGSDPIFKVLWSTGGKNETLTWQMQATLRQESKDFDCSTGTKDGKGGINVKALSDAWQVKIARAASQIVEIQSALTEMALSYVDCMLPDTVRQVKLAADLVLNAVDTAKAIQEVLPKYVKLVTKIKEQVERQIEQTRAGIASAQAKIASLNKRGLKLVGPEIKNSISGMAGLAEAQTALQRALVKYK